MPSAPGASMVQAARSLIAASKKGSKIASAELIGRRRMGNGQGSNVSRAAVKRLCRKDNPSEFLRVVWLRKERPGRDVVLTHGSEIAPRCPHRGRPECGEGTAFPNHRRVRGCD